MGDPGADLLWQNASLQEFFAAYWATRWATPDDLIQVRGWLVHSATDKNSGFHWFWDYVSEMPDAALGTERTPRTTWEKAMAPLYDQTDVRSTEFIYRSWDRMAGTASQRTFLAEFPKLLNGWRGSDAQRIAREMVNGFIDLVGTAKASDSGTFWTGSRDNTSGNPASELPREHATVKQFSIHRFCVQNQEYELFFGSRVRVRHFGHLTYHELGLELLPGGDRHPVSIASWYDAFAFAAWCGCRLPTEVEWEYACRAGSDTPFAVGNGRHLTEEACHFGRDWENQQTIPVDGKPANRWDLFQMHGNVWEWCDNWYTESGLERVVRGGCYDSGVDYCRAAYRGSQEPWLQHFGFRLCRSRPA